MMRVCPTLLWGNVIKYEKNTIRCCVEIVCLLQAVVAEHGDLHFTSMDLSEPTIGDDEGSTVLDL